MHHLLRLAAAFSLVLSTLALSEKELEANFEFDFDTFDFKDLVRFDRQVGRGAPPGRPRPRRALSEWEELMLMFQEN